MTPEQIQQFFTSLAEIKGDIKVVGSDMCEVKNHLEKLNGKTAITQERLIILETEFAPIKTMYKRIIASIVGGFIAVLSYMVYKR